LRVEIDAHTTTGIERTVARAIGLEGVDEHGTPLANLLVDRLLAAGQLGYGVAHRVALECAFQGCTPVEAAEQIAASSQPLAAMQGAPAEPACQALRDAIAASVARIDAARAEREARISRLGQGETPLRYLIVATGNIHDDALQAHSAAYAGADIVAVIRATAQSLLDYVPEGATTEGYGGTYATQENFRILRQALDRASEEYGRYVMGCNYSSGLCMSEIAYMGAVERLDMLLNDSMYGILFRDINMRRTVIDQYFSRRVIARAGIIINTGEDNYLTTADAVEAAHTVLASQFINESLGQQAGLEAAQMGLGHAFEIDPETIVYNHLNQPRELVKAKAVTKLFA